MESDTNKKSSSFNYTWKLNANKREDLKPLVPSDIESRAKHIHLSAIPIITQTQGRVRVARENVVGSPKEINSVTVPTVSKLPTTCLQEDQEGFKSLAITTKISSFQSAPYQYKPPAAAKYFLWDGTKIGDVLEFKTENLVPKQIEIEESAYKSLRIHFMKRELLLAANSTALTNCTCGFFLGKVSDDTILLNRFDSGNDSLTVKPIGALEGDVVIPIFDQKGPGYRQDQYKIMLSRFKDIFEQNPSVNLSLSFPIFCHVSIFENEISQLNHQIIVPNYELEMYQIHPLRIAYTELSHSLSSGNHKGKFGFLSIDQSRQLYFLSSTDPKIYTIPLIGM